MKEINIFMQHKLHLVSINAKLTANPNTLHVHQTVKSMCNTQYVQYVPYKYAAAPSCVEFENFITFKQNLNKNEREMYIIKVII